MGVGQDKTGRGYNVSGGDSVAGVGGCVGTSRLRCDMEAFLLYVILGALALVVMWRDEDWEE